MATAEHGGWFRKKHKPRQARVLTASTLRLDVGAPRNLNALTSAASQIDMTDRAGTRRERALRQGWQSDAWDFRDRIGELRYAIQFLANSAARMRFYPAAYPTGGESDNPVALDDIEGVPPAVSQACSQAITDLGHGKLALSHVAHSLSTNITVAGECFLLGQQDEQTGEGTWTIRSIDEIVIRDDKYQMREIPSDPQGVVPWVDLNPDLTVLSRIWTPHPRFKLLADSPLRAMLDDCESLLILRRMIRATGRSRLAGRGLLGIPEELSIAVPTDDDEDPQADPFMEQLTAAMVEPIADEGVASAVVPMIVRGPGDVLKQIVHIDFASKFDDQSSKVREELIGIIATSMDLPKEIIMGVADLNHWSAWQVDDSTFRYHVEPHVITCCDGLTGAYLRPYLEAHDVDPAWVQRVVMWYDPTDLITHPDQTRDALDLHDRLVLSDEGLRSIAGFSDEDAPSKAEIQVRLLEKMRNWPPNLVMEFLHQWDPTLFVPPITQAGTIPGIKPSGVDVGEAPAAGPGQPALPAAPDVAPAEPDPTAPGPPPSAVTASGAERETALRLSRRLAQLDRDLRTRIQTAANASLLRQLERAGARLRPKVARDETLRARIAHRSNDRVPAILGPDVVTAAGMSARELIAGDWSGLRTQFHEWVAAAQKQALRTAARLARLDPGSDAVKQAERRMAASRDSAWDALSGALSARAEHLLYNPDPNTPAGDWGDLNPDTLVPAGTVRASLAVAGGAALSQVASDPSGVLSISEPLGQIGTGFTIGDLLTGAGGEQAQFEWVHAGSTIHPFEPHEDLDGVKFANFDDDELSNPDTFPANEYLFPGDHDGCMCDAAPQWDFPGNPVNDSSAEE